MFVLLVYCWQVEQANKTVEQLKTTWKIGAKLLSQPDPMQALKEKETNLTTLKDMFAEGESDKQQKLKQSVESDLEQLRRLRAAMLELQHAQSVLPEARTELQKAKKEAEKADAELKALTSYLEDLKD